MAVVDRLREWVAVDGKPWYDRKYLMDYFVTALIFVVQGALTAFIPPFDRYLPQNDPSVSYPAHKNTIPTWSLVPINVVFPLLVFFFVSLFHRSKLHDFHNAALGLLQCLAFTVTVTDAVKTACGRYRPNWDAMQSEYGNEGRMAFPSGHASFSFAGMTFLSFYLCGKTKLFSSRSGSGTTLWLFICIFLPQAMAWFIAITRTRDYWHEFSDILCGHVIGIFWAFVTYFLHYPSLFSKRSDIPKSKLDEQYNPVVANSNNNVTAILKENSNPRFQTGTATRYEDV